MLLKFGWTTRVWLTCVLLGEVLARAQGVDNALTGHVLLGNRPVPNAIVAVRKSGHMPGSAQEILTRTDAFGTFRVIHLLAGDYTVTVTSPGRKPEVREHVVIAAAGEVDLAITFSSPQAVPQPPSGEHVDDTEIQTLPGINRKVSEVSNLSAVADRENTEKGSAQSTYRGTPSSQNVSLVDGADNTQAMRGDAIGSGRPAAVLPRDAISEVTVYGASTAPATVGRSGGGTVEVNTRSGGEKMHGSAFFLWRESAFDAFDPTAIATRYNSGHVSSELVKPKDTRQQWGGRIGGPLLRGKLYGFYAGEWQRRSFPAISAPGDPNFFLLTASQRALLANRGVSAAKIDTALKYLDSLMGEIPRHADYLSQLPKLDWQAINSQRFSFLYDGVRWNAPAGVRTRAVVDRGRASVGSDQMRIDAGQVRWTSRWRQNLTSDLRIRVAHDYEFQLAPSSLPQEPATSAGGFAPQVNVGGDFYFGKPNTLNRRGFPDERRTQVNGLLRWTHAGLELSAGADWNLIHERVDNLPNETGSYTYNSGTTGGRAGGLVDWITDYTFDVNAYPTAACTTGQNAALHYFCFQSYSQSFGHQLTAFDLHEQAAFVQLRWMLRGNLTLDAGIRYDRLAMPVSQRPNAALDAAFKDFGSTSTLPQDGNNIGPRIGLAWTPFGSAKGVLRTSYGVMYGRLTGATIRSALADTGLPDSVLSVRVTSRTEVDPRCSSAGISFGYPATYVCTPTGTPAKTTTAMMFDRRFQLPMVQQGHISFERELSYGLLLRVSGVTAISRQLPNSVDINIAPSTASSTFVLKGGTGAPGVRDGESFIVPIYTARRDANFGAVTDIVSNVNATYNALILDVRRRMRDGLDLRLSGIWQKALDFGQASSATPDRNGQFDPFEIRYDRGISSLDRRFRLVSAAIWESRWRSSHLIERTAFNGWTIAPIFTASSGRPYSFQISGGDALSGGRESINGSGGLRYLPTVGPNTLRLPYSLNLDVRLSKAFTLPTGFRLQLLGEAYNATNHVNYVNVTQRAYLVGATTNGATQLIYQDAATIQSEGLNQRSFGTMTQTSNDYGRQRQLQFGLRLEW